MLWQFTGSGPIKMAMRGIADLRDGRPTRSLAGRHLVVVFIFQSPWLFVLRARASAMTTTALIGAPSTQSTQSASLPLIAVFRLSS